MVKRISVFVCLMVWSLTSYGASFTAQADQQRIALGENLNLRLELSDAEATAPPDLSAVRKSFQVLGQQRSSVSKNINGVSSYSTLWDFALSPLQAGQAVVPSITISTKSGEMKTQPIPIAITNGTHANKSSPVGANWFSFKATPEKSELYRNQPVLIHYELTSQRALQNVQIEDLQIKDAIVEAQGKPEIRTAEVGGRLQHVLTLGFLVTPMKDGQFTIPALGVRGQVSVPRASKRNEDLFGDSDEEDNPFAQMRKMMGGGFPDDFFAGFGRTQPVRLASNPVTLQVLPPVAGIDPWIPADSLKVTEKWSEDKPRVGEPLTRTVVTTAVGLAASELPGFENQFHAETAYKVYADQPVLTSHLQGAQLVSERKDTFTIVPQQEGEITFPALQVSWWNTKTRSREVATVPQKIAQVLPGSGLAKKSPPVPESSKQVPMPAPALSPSADSYKTLLIWLAGGASVLFLLIILFIARRLGKRKQIARSDQTKEVTVNVPSRRDFEKCESARELFQLLQSYGSAVWSTPRNATIGKIFASAQSQGASFNPSELESFVRQFEGGLYAGQPIVLEELKRQVTALLFASGRRNKLATNESEPPDLNPT